MLILATIFIPVFGATLIFLTRNYPDLREFTTLLTAVSLFLVVLIIYLSLDIDSTSPLVFLTIIPSFSLVFTTEPLGVLFALLASFLWIVTSVYSIGYMRAHNEQNQTRFYLFFALALAAVMGVAFSANMFTLFIFYELLTLTTYPLVTHSGTDKARYSGRIYLGYLLGSSISLQLLAMLWTWQITGTLDFTDGGILDNKIGGASLAVLLALYVFGIGKAALVPIHRWLPAAMVAPTPVSALLHAVAVVKTGVFTILKVTLYLFGIDLLAVTGASEWLIYIATATILIASVIAMSKDNLKARLAYSTVSQLAYITLGAMLANTAGVIGSGMHMITHAFGKITLFFCAGAIMVASHKTEVSQMDGLGKSMPFTMAAFLIGSMSIIGLPPMAGMWSKWFLVMGTIQGHYYIPLLVLLISPLLNIAYLLPIPIKGFLGQSHNELKGIQEGPVFCLAAILVTCSVCIILFFYPQPVYELVQSVVR